MQQLNAGSLKTYSSDYERLKHELNKIMKPRYSGAGSNDLYKPKLCDLKKADSFLHNTTAVRPQKANISFPLPDVMPPMFYIHIHLPFLVIRSADRLKKLPFQSRSPFILFPLCSHSFTYLEGDHLAYKQKYLSFTNIQFI
jgi:hypothetical protein